MSESILLRGFNIERYRESRSGISYSENPNVFFDVTFQDSHNYPEYEIAYLSWIQGKGSGIRLTGYILEKLFWRAQLTSKKIRLFIEPTTPSGHSYVNKLSRLGFNMYREESEVNYGSWGYAIEVTQEALDILATEG